MKALPAPFRSAALAALVALAAALAGTRAAAHPLHTTLTELHHDARDGKVRVAVRVFADDFGIATERAVPHKTGAGRAVHYLARRFHLRDARGRTVVLRWKGMRQTDDVLWLQLEGSAPAGLSGGSLRNELMFELFSDQVNIVKVGYGDTRKTLLITPGGRPARLP